VNLCPELRRVQADHARWLVKLARWEGQGEGERAARLLALWEEEILPHCRREEDVLVPELSRRLSEADAIVMFTLADHVALRRFARELRAAKGPERGEVAARLERKLAEHVEFERRTLLPALQEELGSSRLAALSGELGDGRDRPADGPPARATKQEHWKGKNP
jgi:hypothetical protein